MVILEALVRKANYVVRSSAQGDVWTIIAAHNEGLRSFPLLDRDLKPATRSSASSSPPGSSLVATRLLFNYFKIVSETTGAGVTV